MLSSRAKRSEHEAYTLPKIVAIPPPPPSLQLHLIRRLSCHGFLVGYDVIFLHRDSKNVWPVVEGMKSREFDVNILVTK
jgi:hypothetical protein